MKKLATKAIGSMKMKIKKARPRSMAAYAVLLLGVSLLGASVVTAQSSDSSLRAMIAEVAGTILGNRLVDEVNTGVVASDVTTDEPTFGAQPGADAFFPVECHQGVCYGYVQVSMTPTTTACILRNPLNATSTILSWTAKVTANNLGDALGPGGRTTHTFEVSTTTVRSGGYGSTSPAIYAAGFRQTVTGDKRVGLLTGEEPRNFYWTPSHATTTAWRQDNQVEYRNEDEIYLAANEYLTMRIATGTPGSFASGALTGTCSAVFKEVK